MNSLAVAAEDLQCECQQILNTLARGMHGNPELEVFRSVVVLNAVPMVHGLARKQLPSEDGFHDEAVFQHLFAADPHADIATGFESPRFPSKQLGSSTAPDPAMMGLAIAQAVVRTTASFDAALATHVSADDFTVRSVPLPGLVVLVA
jgi:hypothetical protein